MTSPTPSERPAVGRYLYAVTREVGSRDLDGVTGLHGLPVELVDHDGLLAVVSDVDLAEFGEEPLKQNLERLEWVEEVARTHDAVVRAVALRGAAAPFRLVTIAHDDAAVRRRLEAWFASLQEVLDRIEGRAEWSVKAFSPAASPEVAGPKSAPAGGAAYLRAKKEEAERRRARETAALEVADEIHRELAPLAEASRRLPPQDPRLAQYEGTMLLNAAYLVAEASAAAFADAVARLAEAYPDARLTCGGPWPPYSFATLEE